MISHRPTFPLLLVLAILMQGCIHEYPSGNDADPTRVDVTLRINLDMNWHEETIGYLPESKGVRDPDVRVLAVLSAPGTGSLRLMETFPYTPTSSEPIMFQFSTPLHPREYTLSVWCDFLHPVTGTPLGYDITSVSDIRPVFSHGDVSEMYDSRYFKGTLDLSGYAGEWDAHAVVPVTLDNPMGRFRLVAADYDDFLSLFEKEIKRGENYSVAIEYETSIPEAFNLTDDLPVRPTDMVTFSRPLDIIMVPGIEIELASDRLFLPPEGMEVRLKVMVLNSAKALVAQTSKIAFPLQRGKLTTVSGRFLTNFISGGLSVDNEWAGEITIDYDTLIGK